MKLNNIQYITKFNSVVAINLFCLITNILFIGDSMSYHNNRQFSTKDRDNDGLSRNCAQLHHGPFWHGRCGNANLNGEYLRNGAISRRGLNWFHWKGSWYSVKRVEMKIKPN